MEDVIVIRRHTEEKVGDRETNRRVKKRDMVSQKRREETHIR